MTDPVDPYARRRLIQPDWCNAPQPSNWKNACMRDPGHDGDHAVRKDYRLYEALSWDANEVVDSVPAHYFNDLWCPDCDGKRYIVEPRHGCDGIETVCDQVCPVPEQVACDACAPRVQTTPYLPPEEEPF